MYGLGSTDMKAGVAAFLTAALELTERPQQDIYLLLDADEEDLGLGGRQFVKDLNLTNANIIVAEPSDCSIMIGQKGALTMEAKFQGTPTHGSRTSYDYNQQNSAIYKAVRGIAELQKLEADYINQKLEEYGFPTLNIGRIQGGVATNVVAGDCLFSIDRRFLPNEDPQQIIADITNAIITVDESAVVEAQFVGEAFNLEKESELFKTLTDVQTKYFGESKSCIMTGWTQAGLFKKWGSPVIFGPGQLAQAHQADEYCEIDVLEKFVGCYREIIQKLAY
jgi:acetylornithine deacetylase/succinyl-diaminopimelate desuccinylase-like protein